MSQILKKGDIKLKNDSVMNLQRTEQKIVDVIKAIPMKEVPTQRDLASQVGVSYPTFNKYLNRLIDKDLVIAVSVESRRKQKYVINPLFYFTIQDPDSTFQGEKNTHKTRNNAIAQKPLFIGHPVGINFSIKSSISYKDIRVLRIYDINKTTVSKYVSKNIKLSFNKSFEENKIKELLATYISEKNFEKNAVQKLKSLPKVLRNSRLYFVIDGEELTPHQVEIYYIHKTRFRDGRKFEPNRTRKPDFEWNPIYERNDYNIAWSRVISSNHIDRVRHFLAPTPLKFISNKQILKLLYEFKFDLARFYAKIMQLKEYFVRKAHLRKKRIKNAFAYIRKSMWNALNGEEVMLRHKEENTHYEKVCIAIEGYRDAWNDRKLMKIHFPNLRRALSWFNNNNGIRNNTIKSWYKTLGEQFINPFQSYEEAVRLYIEGYGSDPKSTQFMEDFRNSKYAHIFDDFWRVFIPEDEEGDNFGDVQFFNNLVEGY